VIGMSNFAFIFPGQGSQEAGMGKALFDAFPEARAVFEEADEALGEKLSLLCFEGPEEALKLTANTQPAILTVSIAAHAVLAARLGRTPRFMAGHSLGEYSALVASGALSLADGVRAVRARGTLMQEAVPAGQGAMAAVLGLPAGEVARLCAEAAQGEVVSPANYNEPLQTVIAGHAQAVERASELLRAAGARKVLPLPVSAPFHCALMAKVVAPLGKVLDQVTIRPPLPPVVSNVEALPNGDAARVRQLLLDQVTGSVRWVECVEAMVSRGVTTLVEVGPGKVLGGLTRRISKQLTSLHVEDPASLEKTLAALGGTHG
jgi:[acyl-carrier-protein] S-malonyltransferase